MRAELHTWADLVQHIVDYWGGNPTAEARRDARRASIRALDRLTNDHSWSYFYARGRLNLDEAYVTGTVAYDHTGGAYERLVTLSGGTFPTWSARGSIVLADVVHSVAERKSDTQLTLSMHQNPGADVAAGTAYTIYRDAYEPPADFRSLGLVTLPSHAIVLSLDHPQTWLERQRIFRGAAMPRFWTVKGSADYTGSLSIYFFPPPDATYAVDLLYQRRPRPLRIEQYTEGTVSTQQGSAVLTGSGTDWTQKLVGSVVRISDNARLAPTGVEGSNPAALERVVLSVDSATQITMDDTADDSLTAVKYLASDPLDIEPGAMYSALLACCEAQAAKARRMDDREMAEQEYGMALIRAREADARNFSEESVGGRGAFPVRLADMPRGPDE